MKVSTSYPSVNSYQSTVEFHFTPVNKTNALMGWTGFGEIRKAYCWLKCKLRQSLLKLMCQCSSKTFVHLPNDGAVTLLGIYTKSSIYLSRGTYSWSYTMGIKNSLSICKTCYNSLSAVKPVSYNNICYGKTRLLAQE